MGTPPIEGASWQGDMGTRGEAMAIGRDAVAPLPTNSGGELACGHVGKGRGIIFKEACKGLGLG
jgi:hypothetical protein